MEDGTGYTGKEDLIDVSKRDHGLPKDITSELAKVNQPVHIQVMISPS